VAITAKLPSYEAMLDIPQASDLIEEVID